MQVWPRPDRNLAGVVGETISEGPDTSRWQPTMYAAARNFLVLSPRPDSAGTSNPTVTKGPITDPEAPFLVGSVSVQRFAKLVSAWQVCSFC